jgi:hypothetical protein
MVIKIIVCPHPWDVEIKTGTPSSSIDVSYKLLMQISG